jgi:hypothetical protein
LLTDRLEMATRPSFSIRLRRACLALAATIAAASAAGPAGAEPPQEGCLSIDVFVREDCPHCAEAKLYLAQLVQREPRLAIRYHDVIREPGQRARLQRLARERGIERVGVPAFLVCGEMWIGFSAGITDLRLDARVRGVAEGAPPGAFVNLPGWGRVELARLGLPAFTVVLGLVDGLNPCAMWVLLFLISLVVHLRSRSRVVLIAATFVLTSGAAYFAFMAAWLNAFLLVGYSRPLQAVLGLLAIGVGSVHVKDFMAPGAGISLSIPERAKPGLYARMRRIVYAENLPAALCGALVLAVLVNSVELLCTAALPALYTQVLAAQGLSKAAYYGYLALYNAAYIFDDSLVVAAALVTLRHFKLQTRQGRWLKLVSGLVILVLGALLLLAPGALSISAPQSAGAPSPTLGDGRTR